jgi:hypothetical protein
MFLYTSHQFLPILTLLFKHSQKFERVRKFVLENPSYLFVFGFDNIESLTISFLSSLPFQFVFSFFILLSHFLTSQFSTHLNIFISHHHISLSSLTIISYPEANCSISSFLLLGKSLIQKTSIHHFQTHIQSFKSQFI